jgi:hypothetical protein
MNNIRKTVFCLGIVVLIAPALFGQDSFKYRSFSLGTSLASVLKLTEQKLADVKMIHDRPVLLQELTWWPPNLYGKNLQADSVERIVFSFYGGQLYEISVSYDRRATEGLTTDDMIQTLSAKYGKPIGSVSERNVPTADRFDQKQKVVATWEDSLSSCNLVRSIYSNELGLVIFSKGLSAQAEAASAEALAIDERERPQKEAERLEIEGNNLELARQKNLKSFQP